MKLVLTYVLLAICFVSLTSCGKSVNRARQADDVAVCVDLSRSFAESNAEGLDPFRSFDNEIESFGDFVLLPFVIVFHGVVQSSIDSIGKTKFVVYADGKTKYRQRLYWGKNTVYFPVENRTEDGSYPLRVVISGDRDYDGVLNLKPDQATSVDLK